MREEREVNITTVKPLFKFMIFMTKAGAKASSMMSMVSSIC